MGGFEGKQAPQLDAAFSKAADHPGFRTVQTLGDKQHLHDGIEDGTDSKAKPRITGKVPRRPLDMCFAEA
jgi:hypothetical protein